jgi:hypothetical protein
MTEPVRYALGLKPPRPGAVKMRFADYIKPALPAPPAEFGHEDLVPDWHMLGNDQFGCCLWSGAAHEHYLWTAEAGARSHITTADVLADYAACTGFVADDPSTDQGTDMQVGASYRRKTGIVDATGKRHQIGAYAQIEAGNVDELKQAWMLGAIGLGVQVGDNQQQQFSDGKPWDGPTGANAGGHYVPMIAYRGGMFWCVSWGRLTAVTEAFIRSNNDQTLCYFSPDFLIGGKSIDGFDQAALLDDLNELVKG